MYYYCFRNNIPILHITYLYYSSRMATLISSGMREVGITYLA